MANFGNDLTSILAAVVLAAIGGELFLKGILGAATSLRVPKLLVATTLTAFATSSPEFTVSTVAALAGQPETGLGDALGSNIVNIALIFGVALLLGPIAVNRRDLGRNFLLALTVPLLTLWFVRDGDIERSEGLFLLAVFMVWIGLLIRSGLAERSAADPDGNSRPWRSMAFGFIGLAALISAGKFFVIGATGFADDFGIDTYIVGATVVALGTSLPELVTVVLARLRGHDDISIGTLLGSNLFNGLAVVGVAASIHPIRPPALETAVTLGTGMLVLVFLIPGPSERIGRSRGVLLLIAYGIFVTMSVVAIRSS